MKNYSTKRSLKDNASHIAPLRSPSNCLGFLSALMVVLMASPSMAAERNITDIELEQNNNKLELKLSANQKADSKASFFTLRKDNIIEANLLNTDLDLAAGKSFKQENPLPGIKAVEINQVDQEHTQILISTEPNTPIEHLLQEDGENLILSLNRVTKAKSFQRGVEKFSRQAVKNIKQSYKTAIDQTKTKDNKKSTVASSKKELNPDVLIPNPEIVIDDNLVSNLNERVFTAQDSNSQATLPRAVAPPVGDMAVSNISTTPDLVDLGSRALVPRLVLREAPVREVLSLLARSASLNVIFSSGDQGGRGEEETGPTISLDLENQPVQEVFNSVLLVSGLNANRRGNLIYVGEKLPAQARNLISRTVRLNQVTAENAALFLASQGAKGKRLTNEIEEIIDPETGKVVQRNETSPTLSDLDGGSDDDTGTVPLMLKGLQVSTDGRLNAITLVGEPRKVEVATAMLTQLDARRRQVSVNVKVIDVNLLNQDVFNSSFSFGINDSFFVQDRGSSILRFGESSPPTGDEIRSFAGGVTNPPTRIFGSSGDQGQNTDDSDGFDARRTDLDEAGIPPFFQYPKEFLSLLEAQVTSGNGKVLTDPTLTVQEGQQATVKLVQEIVQSVKTDIDGDSGSRTVTPVIGEAGLVLTVNVEQVDDNGFVSFSVSPTISSVGLTQNFDSGGGAENTISLLSQREISSGLIRMRDGETLILSGIIQDQERTTISKVPLLGDIPLLGSLFRSSDKASERAEVIVLLTPNIIEEDAGLASNFMPSKESREILDKSGVGLLGK